MISSSPFPAPGAPRDVEAGAVLQPRFDDQGLVAAVVADATSGEVLMLAWMNAEALALTIETGTAHFWSRSRGRLWKKGAESGNVLAVTELRIDCDQDAVLVRARVEGGGKACHTGARSCFYRSIPLGPGARGQKLVLIPGEG